VVGYDADELEAYTQRGPLARLGLSRPFIGDRLLPAELALPLAHLRRAEPGPRRGDPDGDRHDRSLPDRRGRSETVRFDLRDHPLDPRRGFFTQVVASEGSSALGGTSSFARGTADVRGYLPIGERLVLAARPCTAARSPPTCR
jgi:hypothetical protein